MSDSSLRDVRGKRDVTTGLYSATRNGMLFRCMGKKKFCFFVVVYLFIHALYMPRLGYHLRR